MEQQVKDPESLGCKNPFSPLDDWDWILEAIAPLRFPLAQGLWFLRPWLGFERIADWVMGLEGSSQLRDNSRSLGESQT